MKNIKLVVIVGSAGSFQVVSKLLSELRPDFELPVLLCLHRLKSANTGFEEALNIKSTHQVHEPYDKEVIKKRKIYLAPANYHMLAEIGNTIALSVDEENYYSRPGIDLCLDSFSYIYKNKMLAVILSGANSDGAAGMLKAKQRGSYTIVQDPSEAAVSTMIDSTLSVMKPDEILNTEGIIHFLNKL